MENLPNIPEGLLIPVIILTSIIPFLMKFIRLPQFEPPTIVLFVAGGLGLLALLHYIPYVLNKKKIEFLREESRKLDVYRTQNAILNLEKVAQDCATDTCREAFKLLQCVYDVQVDKDAKHNILKGVEALVGELKHEVVANIGLVLLHADEFDACIEMNRRVLNIDATHLMANENSGLAYMRKGDYDKAKSHFKVVEIRHAEYSINYFNLGHFYKIIGNDELSEWYFAKAVEKEPARFGKGFGKYPEHREGAYASYHDLQKGIKAYRSTRLTPERVNFLMAADAGEKIKEEIKARIEIEQIEKTVSAYLKAINYYWGEYTPQRIVQHFSPLHLLLIYRKAESIGLLDRATPLQKAEFLSAYGEGLAVVERRYNEAVDIYSSIHEAYPNEVGFENNLLLAYDRRDGQKCSDRRFNFIKRAVKKWPEEIYYLVQLEKCESARGGGMTNSSSSNVAK